jgi:uncharacterized protein YjbI with pentapeptide repeats
MTASEFGSKYQNQFVEGETIRVLVYVKGEATSEDPDKKAKEIRYYQAGVLKFIHFAGAVNVVSNTLDNSFTGTMTTSLAEKISTRYDIKSVIVINNQGNKIRNLCSPYGPGADLAGCDLYGVNFQNMDLKNTNFSGANLKGANFEGSDLSNADLRGAFLKYSLLNGANLTGANLESAKLLRAELVDADLTNTNFYRANLYRADLTNADLSYADFRYSILTYAILANANLQGTNLEGAGTWSANLNNCYNHEICE